MPKESPDSISQSAKAGPADCAGDELVTGNVIEPKPQAKPSLMSRVLDRDNLIRALKQVQRNKGAPGIDGVTVDQFSEYLTQYWPTIRQQLLAGMYLDWELNRRGHQFVPYADDFQIYVKSRSAGERVMASITRYVSDSLSLKVNTLKSAVDRP